MNNKIIERILKETNNTNILEALSDKLSLADLQSLLLEIYRRRTQKLDAKQLFAQYKTNRFVQPSPVDPQKYLEFEQLAFSLLPEDFKAVELSPVNPLGSCAVLAPVDQNNVLTTIRNNEVSSDPTNALALECSIRRAENLKSDKKSARVKLCAVHRVLRTQVFEGNDSVPHFKVLSLCTAGKDEGSYKFEIESLKEQFEYFISLLHRMNKINVTIKSVRIALIIFDDRFTSSAQNLADEITVKFPGVKIDITKFEGEQNYYSTLRYNIFAASKNGEEYFLCDGGFTDWTQQILNNKKERYLISGFGIERLFLVF